MIPQEKSPNDLPPSFFTVDFGRRRHQTELESQKFYNERRQRASSFSIPSTEKSLDFGLWEPMGRKDDWRGQSPFLPPHSNVNPPFLPSKGIGNPASSNTIINHVPISHGPNHGHSLNLLPANHVTNTSNGVGLKSPFLTPLSDLDLTLGLLNLTPEDSRSRSITDSHLSQKAFDKPRFSRTISSMAVMTEHETEKCGDYDYDRKDSEVFPRVNSNFNANADSWEEMTERFRQAIATAPSSPITVDGNRDRVLSEKDHNRTLADSKPVDQIPSRTLWIGNIDSISTTELVEYFSQFGKIENIKLLPSRECGFINFENISDAIKAQAADGSRLGNVVVKVGFGRDVSDHSPSSTKSLWVGNISPNTRAEMLEEFFGKFGKVESVRILTHKNCGFVNFERVEDAVLARDEVNGSEVGGSIVKIGFAKVPRGEITKEQALSNPGILAGLAKAAMEKNVAWVQHMPNSPKMFENVDSSPFVSIPITIPNRKHDQARLREIRKKLETNLTTKEIEVFFNELISHADELASDYIGNVIVQRFMEKGTDSQRQTLIEKIAPRMASLGIHKNGTWAVQKIIDIAKTPKQVAAIVECLRVYAPALLMDQFGNYVIQCCLRLGSFSNQFIFDAISSRIWDIGQNRFGARATKACLENEFTTSTQQKQVSLAIAQSSVQLSMNANGSILLTWLLDSSMIPGRYRVVAPTLVPHLKTLGCHKLASQSLLKIILQKAEIDARELLIKGIFEDTPVLSHLLCDYNVGCVFITKILSTGCQSDEERASLASLVRQVVSGSRKGESNNHKRLLEELSHIPMTLQEDKLKPLTPCAPGFYLSPTREVQTTSQAAEEPAKYSSYVLPTPSQSPVHSQNREKQRPYFPDN